MNAARGGSSALSSWTGHLLRASKAAKHRARLLDQFVYLVYATVVSRHDPSSASASKAPLSSASPIDITDGVILTDLLNHAKLAKLGTPLPSEADRHLFLLKPRLQILTSYSRDCEALLSIAVPFSAQQLLRHQVAAHVLVEHFFQLYSLLAQKYSLPSFHFDSIFPAQPEGAGDIDPSPFEMEQIQENVKLLLSGSGEQEEGGGSPPPSGANKFSVAMKASPAFRYVNRDRLLKKMDTFYAPLHAQSPLPAFSDAALDCERLHIDDFDEYYQRVVAVERAKSAVEKRLDKREKEIVLLREIIQSQNKLLDGLNLDIGLLASENELKARVAAGGGGGKSKAAPEASAPSRQRDLVKESRRLSKQIQRLTFNFQKDIMDLGEGEGEGHALGGDNISESSKSSGQVSTESAGVQCGGGEIGEEGREQKGRAQMEEEGGWVVAKWEEMVARLEREKRGLEEEGSALRARVLQLEGESSAPHRLRSLELRVKEQEQGARRHEEEYSILLSENTRLRNELDEALRTSRPLLQQFAHAAKEGKASREQNREFKRVILEQKAELARLEHWRRVADNDEVKGLVATMDARIQQLEASNNELKAQLQAMATSSFNRPRA